MCWLLARYVRLSYNLSVVTFTFNLSLSLFSLFLNLSLAFYNSIHYSIFHSYPRSHLSTSLSLSSLSVFVCMCLSVYISLAHIRIYVCLPAFHFFRLSLFWRSVFHFLLLSITFRLAIANPFFFYDPVFCCCRCTCLRCFSKHLRRNMKPFSSKFYATIQIWLFSFISSKVQSLLSS